MIGQCLSNKNEIATISKSKNFLDLNKALPGGSAIHMSRRVVFSVAKFENFI